jgi:hypothetical protein
MVGCTAERFQEWIKFQWTPGMAADNYGSVWTYDHVVPRSAFDFLAPEQVLECNHWTNLRPVLATENSKKYNKRDPTLEAAQAMTAYIFQLIQNF